MLAWERIPSLRSQATFRLTLGFVDEAGATAAAASGALGCDTAVVEWSSATPDAEVLERVRAALANPAVVSERVEVAVTAGGDGVVSAAAPDAAGAAVRLTVRGLRPALRSVELVRAAGSGTVSAALGAELWAALELGDVARLRLTEGVASLWDERVLGRLAALRVLDLSGAGLPALPGAVGALARLRELRLAGNKLRILPPELGRLAELRVLDADANELSILPGELRRCAALEELSLEGNRLAAVLLGFRDLPRLRALRLYNNPLEYLPEIAPCRALRELTVANLRVRADAGYQKFDVDLLPPAASVAATSVALVGGGKPADELAPIFALLLRRSSGHHPLLAGALRALAEDPRRRALIAAQGPGALQQLILMTLNDDAVVVAEACAALRLLALHSPALAEAVVKADLGSMLKLIASRRPALQRASLRVLAAVGFASPAAAAAVLSDALLACLRELAGDSGAPADARAAALEALGNLAFGPRTKARLVRDAELMEALLRLADPAADAGPAPPTPPLVRTAAVRALAVLGENEAVARLVGRPLRQGRGVRVLSMDGGGMKGMATVRLLRQLEERSGRRLHELFDLIVGTSTGGLLGVALGLRQFTLADCEAIYKVLGQRVFSAAAAAKDREESWTETAARVFHSKTQHVRAVVVGCKHDAAVYEALLKDYCDVAADGRCLGNAMIDAACLPAPKVALVSALASAAPARPFVFRSYELPPAGAAAARGMAAAEGGSRHAVWEAVRASSAAIYYLDDFACGGERFQDGAVVANNPAVVALQEARLLWPDAPIDVLVSVGTGSEPDARRGRGGWSYVDTGNILIESATSVHRAHEALATTLPLVPGLRYFRFNPVDARCGMELDDVDPLKWAALEAAVDEFAAANAGEFDRAAAALVEGLGEAREARGGAGGPRAGVAGGAAAGGGAAAPGALRLGARRGVLVVAASRPDPSAADLVGAACGRLPACARFVDLQALGAVEDGAAEPPARGPLASHALEGELATPGKARPAGEAATPPRAPAAPPAAPAAAALASPPKAATVEVDLTGAIGSMLSWFSPSKPAAAAATAAAAAATSQTAAEAAPAGLPPPPPPPPPLSPTAFGSPAPAADRAAAAAATARLEAELRAAPADVGVLHLALHPSPAGLVLRWDEQVEALSEPSAAARGLLQRAGHDPNATTLSALFERHATLDVGGAEVRIISKQVSSAASLSCQSKQKTS
jgi:hypothetical protein